MPQEPFTYWGHVDIESIKAKLSGLNWGAYTYRQKTFGVHANTQTVPLLWNEKPDHEHIKEHPAYPVFERDLFAIQKMLPPGRMHTALLIKLPAGTCIPTHRDAAPHFKLYRRIHVPIVTNPGCLFTVGTETRHLKAGDMWEIDNDNQLHSVVNGGNEDRVHLLIDYFVFTQ